MLLIMQILNFFKKDMYKKGRSIVRFLPFFLALFSCSTNISQYGRVVKSGLTNTNSFIFSVTEEYLEDHKKSVIDKNNPKMTKAESWLLLKLLQDKKYCLNEKGETSFRIKSKQEKIYDMTFAHLIEENYNARPVTPRMYYGECFNRESGMTSEELVKKAKDDIGKLK